MNMKRFLAWILMLCMVMGLLCGCGDTGSFSKKDRDEEDEEEKVTIEETVVYEENDIEVTVTGLGRNSMGRQVKVTVENNSEYDIVLTGSDFVVNGIMLDGWLYVEVSAGEETEGAIEFYTEDMKAAGVEQLATVNCVDAYVFDANSFNNLFECPFSFETSIAGEHEQEIDDSGEVLFEEDGITVIAKGAAADDETGATVTILVINETGEDIIVESENVSVNDYTVDGWMYDRVLADTVRFAQLTIWTTELEENDIDDVEEISFSLSFRYVDNWKNICETDVLTFTVD